MSNEKGDWRLSVDERHQARLAGVNAAIAAHVGADHKRLQILTTKNVKNTTLDGVFGFMEVTAEWAKQEGKWHWHSWRFNGEKPLDLSDEHITLLGGFACSRETETNDYTRGAYGVQIQRPEAVATILEMPQEYAQEQASPDVGERSVVAA